jgi:hypothetical protein
MVGWRTGHDFVLFRWLGVPLSYGGAGVCEAKQYQAGPYHLSAPYLNCATASSNSARAWLSEIMDGDGTAQLARNKVAIPERATHWHQIREARPHGR